MKITPIRKPTGKARLSVTWSRNPRWNDWTAISEGCYLLRTNLTDVDPATLWKRYIQLTEAEWAFRITKDELEIRPILRLRSGQAWHQREERVLAHILVLCRSSFDGWLGRPARGFTGETPVPPLMSSIIPPATEH